MKNLRTWALALAAIALTSLTAVAAPALFEVLGPVVSVTRTNDTNAYGAGDIVGSATGSTAALAFQISTGPGQYMITTASLEIDAAAIISGETSYSLECYNATPPSALGDNAVWDIPSGDRVAWQGVGEIALGTPLDRGATLYVQTDGINHQVTTNSGTIFCYLVTAGAYTPTASRVYVVTLHATQL